MGTFSAASRLAIAGLLGVLLTTMPWGVKDTAWASPQADDPEGGAAHDEAVGGSLTAESELAGLLGRPISPTAEYENGWTDLHYAAILNMPDAVTALLSGGCRFGNRGPR